AIASDTENLVRAGAVIKVQASGGESFIHKEVMASFRQTLTSLLSQYHKANPLRPGMPKEELRQRVRGSDSLFSGLIPLLKEVVMEKEVLRLREFSPASASVSSEAREKLISLIEKSGLQPPFREELMAEFSMKEKEMTDILRLLTTEGLLVRINDSLYMTKVQHEKMIGLLRKFFSEKKEMTVADFRDLLSTTRKYALPLLEHLDSRRVTIRVGDIRKFMLK
ncbi:MAG: hypothetical protein HGA78_00765, partial [Nitrospirales bacterium]|nr:hypothetical protein [Nitrospirales bacterium]